MEFFSLAFFVGIMMIFITFAIAVVKIVWWLALLYISWRIFEYVFLSQ